MAHKSTQLNLDRLAKEFDQDLLDGYNESRKQFHYNASRFLQMLQTYGGVETAKRLLNSGPLIIYPWLRKMYLEGRLDLTIEARVLRRKYKPLFDERLRNIARERLTELQYSSSKKTQD